MLFQKLGYTDVKTKIMFIQNKITFYQMIGVDLQIVQNENLILLLLLIV